MEEIKAGDQVILKSGGPTLTVRNVGEYDSEKDCAFCEWFDGTKNKHAVFALITLKKIDDKPGYY